MAKETPEGYVKDEIKDFLALHMPGSFAYMPVPSKYGKMGMPDFILCVPTLITQDMVGTVVGRYVGIEAKDTGKGPTARQQEVLDSINQAGGVGICAAGRGQTLVSTLLDMLRRITGTT